MKCLSNLRQIGLGQIQYCTDNKGYFCAGARGGQQYPEDFIYWQQPAGAWDTSYGWNTGYNQRDLDHGKLVKYMGNRFIAAVWTCPSDDVTSHLKFSIGSNSNASYPYSYEMNFILSCQLYNQSTYGFPMDRQRACQTGTGSSA